jgi:hypothetical protein
MSDKNLEKQIQHQICVKIGKSATEILALFMLAYGDYTKQKLSVLNSMGSLRRGKLAQEVGQGR